MKIYPVQNTAYSVNTTKNFTGRAKTAKLYDPAFEEQKRKVKKLVVSLTIASILITALWIAVETRGRDILKYITTLKKQLKSQV